MKKECFKYLYSFKYKGDEYLYLYNKKYPIYFVKYDKNAKTIDIPDFGIFKEIFNKYNSLDYCYYTKDDIHKLCQKLRSKIFFLKPLVRTSSGIIALAVALSMCGCKQVDKPVESTSIISEDNTTIEDINSYFKKHNIEISEKNYNDNIYYFVDSFYQSSGEKVITLKNIDELKALTGLTVNPTYDDVLNAFNQNNNIPEEYLKCIIDGLNNMKNSEEFKNFDLSVLYLNASRMKIIPIPQEELKKKLGQVNGFAYFDCKNAEVYYPSDIPFQNFEFLHEVIGHGSLAFKLIQDNNIYNFDGRNQLMIDTEDRYTGYMIGTMFSEGAANSIARVCQPNNTPKSFYQLFEEELRVIAGLCNVSIGELLNKRGQDFYDFLYANYINDPVSYIIQTDSIANGVIYTEFSTLLESLAVDATYEKYVYSNKEVQKQILNMTVDLIRNSQFKDGMHFDYKDGSVVYNPKLSANNYEEIMSKYSK